MYLLRVAADAVAHGNLLGLDVVTVVSKFAIVEHCLERKLPAAVQSKNCRVGQKLCSLPDVLGPPRVVAVRAVLDFRVIPI